LFDISLKDMARHTCIFLFKTKKQKQKATRVNNPNNTNQTIFSTTTIFKNKKLKKLSSTTTQTKFISTTKLKHNYLKQQQQQTSISKAKSSFMAREMSTH